MDANEFKNHVERTIEGWVPGYTEYKDHCQYHVKALEAITGEIVYAVHTADKSERLAIYRVKIEIEEIPRKEWGLGY